MSTNAARGSVRYISPKIPRLAIIGCGAITEEYYLPALAEHRADVLGKAVLVDVNDARARYLAHKFAVPSHRSAFADVVDDVDAAIIAVPTHLHHPVSLAFLSRGIPVLCEKPLAESAIKAREMIEAAGKQGAPLAVNYLQRFIPSFAKVEELLHENSLGQATSLKYYVAEQFRWPTVSGFYFNSPVSARGILRDRGAHVFDHICWWLAAKPTLVSSQNDSFGGSEAVAHVRFRQDRCCGEARLSWLANSRCAYEITCDGGTISGEVYDYCRITVQSSGRPPSTNHAQVKRKTKLDIANLIVSNFLEVLSKGAAPLVTGTDVLDSIAFIDECYANATRMPMPWYQGLEVERGH